MKSKSPIFFIAVVIVLSTAFLTGCFPAGDPYERSSPDAGMMENNLPESGHIAQELSESVKINADVDIPDNAEWRVFDVALKEFTEDDISSFLSAFQNGEVTEEYHSESGLAPGYEGTNLTFADGSYLACDAGQLLFNAPAYYKRDYENEIMGTSYFLRDDLGEIYINDVIPNLDKEDAVAAVQDAITALGISVSDPPTIYALDYETMTSRWEDYITKDGTPAIPWQEDEGAYVVVYREAFEGVPVTDRGYVEANQDVFCTGGRIMGVFSRKGLICMSLGGIYEPLNSGETDQLLPLDGAIDVLARKYTDMLVTEPIQVTRIEASLVPYPSSDEPGALQLIPAWVFWCRQSATASDAKGEYQSTSFFPVIVNGLTGAELRIEGTL
ncbi:MAG: hypothetical protein LBR26_06025 [Prevotella sp.]|jgi:hypothetical protein|nr:hypothetical protein [Prevotella sp.]